MLAENIVELELNYAKGWRGRDVAFLAMLPRLESIFILDHALASVDPIHALHALRALDVVTARKIAIDFSAFPRLEHCGLEWHPGCQSVFSCMTLQELFVNMYDGEDAAPFGRLRELASLSILSAPFRTLHGLHDLGKLRSLRLGNLRRLTSLAGLEGLVNLEELNIDTCRGIQSIDAIGELTRLRTLFVNNVGPLASLAPLDRLRNLEWVTFDESTNILDGDLSPLSRQRHLTRVAFRNRRHYSHRREDFDVLRRPSPASIDSPTVDRRT